MKLNKFALVSIGLLTATQLAYASPGDFLVKYIDTDDTTELNKLFGVPTDISASFLGFDNTATPYAFHFNSSQFIYDGTNKEIKIGTLPNSAMAPLQNQIDSLFDNKASTSSVSSLSSTVSSLSSSLSSVNSTIDQINGNLFGTSTNMLASNASTTNGLMSKSQSIKLDAMPSTLATVATTGSYNDLADKPTSSYSNPTRSLNSCFQVSSTKDATVSYSVDIDTTLSLSAGSKGTVFLEYYTDSGCTTGTTVVSRATGGNTGTLVVGANLAQTTSGNLMGSVPAGKYVKIRTANTTGTPTFTLTNSQERI